MAGEIQEDLIAALAFAHARGEPLELAEDRGPSGLRLCTLDPIRERHNVLGLVGKRARQKMLHERKIVIGAFQVYSIPFE
jgi:hypothetical protein